MEDAALKALVLGANGQDGSYLCETLIARGYDVTAVARQPQARWPVAYSRYNYATCDIADTAALEALLARTRPGRIFHFAAIHGAAGTDYEAVWQAAHLVNTLSVHAALEYIRRDNPACGLVYASSALVFGSPLPARINENTPRRSTSIYTITKNSARELIDYYRVRHGVAASVLYLFNHESTRRPAQFFVPRIAKALAGALGGSKSPAPLHSLDFACDWGDASEFMAIAVDVGERGLGQDYIVASGKTWTGREMARQLFARHGLDYAAHLTETNPASGPPAIYQADTARLRAAIGRVPERSVLDICEDIMRTGA